ncbi:MAG: NHL repeat containing protein [Candidatus Woesebacteria bacterium GW2011_GWA1_39_21]|uniref:NHL repeat containing protein n=1 Tax=Candidatus Woesebacteria bacterium GW2011_GWA1_39_21 TaxID=1618550 RepID=A0A0G0N0J9_9BACT|nr:MAG: NHL repeat containing protein [Candidatus Woesebacteria bacterium GW2011_GWA1_39_21]
MKYKIVAFFSFLFLVAVISYLFSGQKLLQSSLELNNQITSSTPTIPPTQTGKQPNSETSQGKSPEIPLDIINGFSVHVYADNLRNPRDLQFTPGGTLLVSNPNSNNVYALPDKNKNGVADEKKVIISNENHVHGLAFYQDYLYIADTTQVVRYMWDEQKLSASFDKVLLTLPRNSNHNNRTIVFNNQGQMFVSLGSTCNVCIETPQSGGSVMVSDTDGNNPQIFATGLRNAPFMAINPKNEELWATEMGRDNLGDNIPPDEINIVHLNKNYGWPYCFGDKVHDDTFDPLNTHRCDNTQPPVYEIPAHSAPLGLVFINSPQFPNDWQGDLLVAYHGSWNRSVPAGYKVVHLKVNSNEIASSDDFLTGFAPASTPKVPGNSANAAKNRPVDLTFDNSGNLYLSDDKGGNIYIIQKDQ